ncbi:hypothetical protein LEM8419_03566 [Neolewinella maritima]|uniref:Tape measure protein N-terminal domain-containing protein n=1 Tax=Neolewinella maritima TaxID=1383882 RepID=A0ABM9B5M3_9BACT|nr:tape measure protein [Neolewinella maritima]CAH1002694.1 hypothetical protein LEM8419_03566 [Neolewinella maritima]
MATIARDNIIIRFIAESATFERERRKLLQQTKAEAETAARTTGGFFSRIAETAGGFLTANLIQGAISGLGALGGKALQLSKDYEQTKISFEVLTGSITEAVGLLERLDKFSLETPFEPTQINNAAKTLLGFGRSVQDVEEDIRLIGNASAATGADLENLAVIFGQVAGVNKLGGQDALQLINAGIPVYDLLATTLGKSTAELKELQSQGKITFQDLRDAFEDAGEAGGKFEGALIKQSTTFAGLTSTAKGAFDSILRNGADALLPLIRQILPPLIEGLFKVVEVVKSAAEPLSRVLVGTFQTFSEIIQPIVTAVRSFFNRFTEGTTSISAFQPVLNFLARTFSVVATVLGFVIDGLGAFFDALRNSAELNSFIAAVSRVPQQFGGIIRVIEQLPQIVRDAFGSAKQSVADFAEDLVTILDPRNLYDVFVGNTSFADLFAENEASRLAALENGTRQQYKGLGRSVADAYNEGYAEIEGITVEIPEPDAGDTAAATAAGREVGKAVGEGINKGVKETFAPINSLAGLKEQVSSLEKILATIADPTGDGIEQLRQAIDDITKQEDELARIDRLIARMKGEEVTIAVTPLTEDYESALDKVLIKTTKTLEAYEAPPLTTSRKDREEQRAAAEAEAVEAISLARDLSLQLIDIAVQRKDAEIAASQGRLSELSSLAEDGNAEQLQLERERLSKLQLEREKAVRQKQQLAAVEIAVNTAVSASESIRAITEAFAIGNIPLGIATAASLALTVGATVLTITQAFGDLPSFRVGTERFDPTAPDGDGGALAVLHRGERVLTAEQNAPLLGWGVRNDEVPHLVGMALGHIAPPQPVYAVSSPNVDMSGVEGRLASQESLTKELIRYVRGMGTNVVIDERGVRKLGDVAARHAARKAKLRN